MTVGISTTNLANKWLDMLHGTAFTAPAATWVELHTADPGANGTTSVSVGSTTRLQATLGTSAGGSTAISGSIGPWTNGGTSETLSHIAVFSLSSAGTFYFSAALTASQAWASTNTFTLTSLSFAFTPLAA
jgi:hypothetical protein